MDVGKSLQRVVTTGRMLALILAIFSAFTYVITLILGPVLYFSTSDGLKDAGHVIHQLPLDIFMLYIVTYWRNEPRNLISDNLDHFRGLHRGSIS